MPFDQLVPRRVGHAKHLVQAGKCAVLFVGIGFRRRAALADPDARVLEKLFVHAVLRARKLDGVVAPTLEQAIGHQAVEDDVFAERRPQCAVAPAFVQVPVVGDFVIVENHQRGDVRQGARHLGRAVAPRFHAFPLAIDSRFLGLPPLGQRVAAALIKAVLPIGQRIFDHGGHAGVDRAKQLVIGRKLPPDARTPRGQVHRGKFAEREQVVVARGGRHARVFADKLAPPQRREVRDRRVRQLGQAERAVIVERVDADHLARADQIAREAVEHGQQACPHIVGINLVARQVKLLRALAVDIGVALFEDVVQPGERVKAAAVRFAAATVHQPELIDGAGQRDKRGQAIGDIAQRELPRRGLSRGLIAQQAFVTQTFCAKSAGHHQVI